VRQAPVARALARSGARELFVLQALRHSSREQQTIQSALIFSQHPMRSTRREANAHQTELASAVSSDRIYQIK